MNKILERLKGGMIVSCQAEGDDPFNSNPEYMALFARAAETVSYTHLTLPTKRIV